MQDNEKDYKKALITAASLTLILAFIYGAFGLENPTDTLIQETISDDLGNEYKITIEDGKANYAKTGTSTNLQVTEHLGNKTIQYKSSGSKLIINDTSTQKTEKLITPGGELITGEKNGSNVYEYQGLDKEQLEEKKDELREEMEQELSRLEDTKRRVIRQNLPDMKVTVNKEDSEDTFFEVTNNGEDTINIDNWKIEGLESDTNSRDAEHLFEPKALEEGETLKVYTEDDNQIDEDEEEYVVADEMTIYSSQTDTVVLYNDFGEEITRETYNQ